MRQTVTVGLAVLLLACCGEDSGDEVTTLVAETTTTVSIVAEPSPEPPTPATSTTVLTELTTKTTGGLATQLIEGLRYHPAGEPFTSKSGEVDVIAPTAGGPYPTVVVFHGGPTFASKEWHRLDAQLIAEQGRVVFLPNWGKHDLAAIQDIGTQGEWELSTRESECAVAFARSLAAEFGGDPDHITLYGSSAGATAVLMAGLSEVEPLDSCSVPGPAGDVQALVPVEADWVIGGHGDTTIKAVPEAFYSVTPWRFLDGSQDIPIHVMVAEITGSYKRSVEPDPATSWLSYRHSDIDLVADLDARGYLSDGEFSVRESGEYAVEILREAGYNVTLAVMPGATHDVWGTEGTAAVVETVVNAGRR